jgi:hypothetical protein
MICRSCCPADCQIYFLNVTAIHVLKLEQHSNRKVRNRKSFNLVKEILLRFLVINASATSWGVLIKGLVVVLC